MVNLFFAYELDAWSQDFNTAFFSKNADPDKCSYSGYGIGFNFRSLFTNV